MADLTMKVRALIDKHFNQGLSFGHVVITNYEGALRTIIAKEAIDRSLWWVNHPDSRCVYVDEIVSVDKKGVVVAVVSYSGDEPQKLEFQL